MTRRPFLDQPGAWGAKRTGQSAVDAACAVERMAESGRHPADWWILAGFLAAVVALIAGVL